MLSTIPVAAGAPAVTATWDAPTEGSPVVFYVLEIYEDGELFIVDTTEDTSFVVPAGIFLAGPQYTARVRGVDAQDRTGPWSLWSDPYVFDPGPPGGCGPIQWSW
jgi:hypothetical protein